MNLKPVFASLCAMSCVAIPMSASAQDYYARQKIEKLEPAQTSSPAPAPAPSATPTPVPTPEITYAWREGEWSNWSSECSDEATRFRIEAGDNGSGRMTILNENARVLTVQTAGVSSGFYPDCS